MTAGDVQLTTIWVVEIRPTKVSPAHATIGGTEALYHNTRLFYVKGRLDHEQVGSICEQLLCDPVVEQNRIEQLDSPGTGSGIEHPALENRSLQPSVAVTILPKPGVMDPVALSAGQAIRELGFEIVGVRTGRRYVFDGISNAEAVRRYVGKHLANALIEEIHIDQGAAAVEGPDPFVESPPQDQAIRMVALCEADDAELLRLSSDGHLFLNLAEMQAIRDHYRAQGREPTDVELETLAQTWSEHCVHKTLKSEIHYCGDGFPVDIRLPAVGGRRELSGTGQEFECHYDNLLADTIAAATEQLNKPWCLSVFKDNAGIIEFDEHLGVAFKVETHNHPSALEPYGGAATGVGGCIRDIMGCGLGARPIANTDVFCFANPNLPDDRVPKGVIHPGHSVREVVRGVRDYGNRMGIPTVNGAIYFDDRYLGNPLVYCGCVGIIPRQHIDKMVQPGDHIVLVGGRTGRDGIHGATFSSGAVTDTHADVFAHAVQIGNAITEKKVLDVLLQARDHDQGCLYSCVTDCGAGGLSSAVGEMAEHAGAQVQLERVPLKYAGLRYDEIWISEAQERMVLAVPAANVKTLIELFNSEDVEATDIGLFTDSGRLELFYDDQRVGDVQMHFLHNGLPRRTLEATWSNSTPVSSPNSIAANLRVGRQRREPQLSFQPSSPSPQPPDLYEALLESLSSPNVASKEWVIRQYDHEVQAASVIKPLMGPCSGPTDAAVLRPVLNSTKGVVLSCGLAPHVSDLDPYVMACAAFDEAVRNSVCVGGQLQRMAVLDNFCWGGVSEAHELGALVRAAQACHDAALAYGIPFISGKDSLNNVFEMDEAEAGRLGWPARISIPHTLLISAISVIDDVTRCRSSELKDMDARLLLVRPRGTRMQDFASTARRLSELIRTTPGIRSCHDCSDGGLLVAAAEMIIGSDYGLALNVPSAMMSNDLNAFLFCENIGHYLIELREEAVQLLTEDAALDTVALGQVTSHPRLELLTQDGSTTWSADKLRRAWRRTFDW